MSPAPLVAEAPVASTQSHYASRNLTRGEEKRAFVQRLFTRIAPRYDWFNRLASLGLDQRWRRELVSRSGIAPGMRVLDVCAGTGDLAMLCAQRQGGIGEVIGIDMNGAMLSCAHRKQRARGFTIQWLVADAQALPFPTSHFDRVVIGFSTRNLSDLAAGLREMVRVLRPQGQLLILETGYPANPLLRPTWVTSSDWPPTPC
jgi:demethylmenaquinone methyltransferase/2-methoxy-6-polyprenyl-1,4-benzoquinol methylase